MKHLFVTWFRTPIGGARFDPQGSAAVPGVGLAMLAGVGGMRRRRGRSFLDNAGVHRTMTTIRRVDGRSRNSQR